MKKKKRRRPDGERVRSVHRLDVRLAEIEPAVWRQLEVDSSITLMRLHEVIQAAFGWESYHLWELELAGARYGDPEIQDPDPELKDARQHRLEVVAPAAGAKLQYLYDFGDDWVHQIEILAVEPAPDGKDRPDAVCTGGARACPPEDCGGPHGYLELLQALRDETHERHHELVRWLGGPFDSEAFDREAINQRILFDQLLASFANAGEVLPPAVEAEILALGDRAIAPLIAILEDLDLGDESAPGAGWAPIHAARLLAELRAVDAIEPMLTLLEETDWVHVIHDTILQALPKIGVPVLEPALHAFTASRDREHQDALLGVLSRIGVRDPRIFALLIESWERDPMMAAADLADYGDPEALPLLLRRFDAVELDPTNDSPAQELIELEDAIIALGGELTEAQRDKLDLAHQPRTRLLH